MNKAWGYLKKYWVWDDIYRAMWCERHFEYFQKEYACPECFDEIKAIERGGVMIGEIEKTAIEFEFKRLGEVIKKLQAENKELEECRALYADKGNWYGQDLASSEGRHARECGEKIKAIDNKNNVLE